MASKNTLLKQRDYTVLDFTELVCRLMDLNGVTRAELGRRLSRTQGYVTRLLDGRAKLTVETMADVATALGYSINFTAVHLETGGKLAEFDWTPEFRLAAIHRIMRRVMKLREKSQEPADRIPAYQWITEIYYLSGESDGRSLSCRRAFVESALGCTLEDVRREMADES